MIVAAGAVLRCYQISTRSLWFDESLTYWTSQLPTAALLDRLSRGVHPPAHYLILKLWTHLFGTSLLALRSLSVLFGSITIVGVYLFTVEALRDAKDSESSSAPSAEAKTTGLWAAALVALSVFHIRWSWDVRMYSLGAALAAFSSWVLLRALHSPTRRWDLWLLYALLALLFAYTHNIALFSIAAQALFVAGYLLVQARWKILGVIRLPKFPCAVLAGTIICLGWLPWASVVLRQRGTIEAGHWVPPVSWKYTGANAYHMFVEPECIEPGAIPWETTVAAVLSTAVCLFIPPVLLWKPRLADACTFTLIATPVVLCLLASTFFNTRVFYSRYLLFAHLFFLVGVALLLSRAPRPWLRRLTGMMLLLLFIAVDFWFIRKLDLENNPGARGVVAYIESRRRPEEPVVVCSQMFYLSLHYHALHDAGASGWYQYQGNTADPGWDAWTAFGAENVIDQETLRDASVKRVWVVETVESWSQHRPVPVPAGWVAISRKAFTDTYGLKTDMVVVEYETGR